MSHISNIYSIYDRKAGYYLPLFMARTEGEALRQFNQIVIGSDTDISKYPADFDLVLLGTIKLESGVITPEELPEPIINGLVALQNVTTERRRYERMLKTNVADEIANFVHDPEADND